MRIPQKAALHIDYQAGIPKRRGRWLRRVGLLLLVATATVVGCGNRSAIQRRSRLIYWQHRCAVYVDDGQPVWVDKPDGLTATELREDYVKSWPDYPPNAMRPFARQPHCWQRLRGELVASGCPVSVFFQDAAFPILFLHELTSPNGTRRIVCVEMRPNIDHSQMCSFDCIAIAPATFTTPPRVTYDQVEWVPGWWHQYVHRGKLRMGKVDVNDPSHFAFQYEQDADSKDDAAFHGSPDENKPCRYRVDGRLKDDGSVEISVSDGEPIRE